MAGVSTPNLPLVGGLDEFVGNVAISGVPSSVRTKVSDIIGPLQASIAALQFGQGDGTFIYVGEQFDKMRSTYLAANGATLNVFLDRIVGMNIPAGQTGRNSYVSISLPFTPDIIKELTGRSIAIKLVCDATYNILTDHPFTSDAVEVGFGTGVYAGSVISTSQDGTYLTRIVLYTINGTETDLGVVLKIATGSITSAFNHVFTVKSITWRVIANAGSDPNSAVTAPAETVTAATEMVSAKRTMFGDIFPDIFTNNTFYLQAIGRVAPDDRVLGWTIPIGGFGGASILQYIWQPSKTDATALAGRTLRVTLGVSCNAEYARLLNPSLYIATVSGFALISGARVTKNRKVSSTRFVIEMLGVWQAGDTFLAPTIVNGPDGITAQTDWILLTDLRVEILQSPSDVFNEADENAMLAARLATQRAIVAATGPKASLYYGRKTVAQDGSGDFTTIADGLAAYSDQGPARRYELQLAPGTYAEKVSTVDYVDIRGELRDMAVISFVQPNNAPLSSISTFSAIDAKTTTRLSALNAIAENARYALHCDSFKADPNGVLDVEDCHFVHNGNAGARAYQTSIGADPGLVWAAEAAVGYGASDGLEMNFRRCTMIGGPIGTAVTGHNNSNFTAPWRVLFEHCRIVCRDPNDYAISFGSLGSRRYDVLRLVGTSISGAFKHYFSPWLATAPADQIAFKAAECSIRGHGNTPTPYVQIDDGSRALRIDSATTGVSSSVVVSGSAVAILFGSTKTIVGNVGLAGAVYGTWDVGDHQVGLNLDQNITQLGKRLGDCTAVSKSLVVTVNGGAPITITFNANYTAVSNASILSTINTALSSSATASLFNVNDLYRPVFSDEEASMQNTTGTTIFRKTGVKYVSSERGCAPMTATDDPSIFAGIAYEDMPPNAWGRVKTRGAVRVANDMIRSDSGSFALGDTFGIGATAGQFVKSPIIPLMTAINSGDVKW